MNVPVHYGAVTVAALVSYVLGGGWYGPLFGESWRRLSGVAEAKPTPFVIMAGLISSLAMSVVLSHAIVHANAFWQMHGILSGLLVGACGWLGLVAPVTVGSVLYENKPWRLWLLNSGYWLTSLLVMGMILAVWR